MIQLITTFDVIEFFGGDIPDYSIGKQQLIKDGVECSSQLYQQAYQLQQFP